MFRSRTLAAMAAAAVAMPIAYTQPYSPTVRLGATRARTTPEGMVTQIGSTYRRHPSHAHARPNPHSARAKASEGADPRPAAVTMMPQMVMTSPANRAAFCSARRRISHRTAEYKLTATPTARTVTAPLFPYTSCVANAGGPGNADYGKEPHDPGQPLNRWLMNPAHGRLRPGERTRRRQQGRRRAPSRRCVPSLADRGGAASQQEDRADVRHRLSQQRNPPPCPASPPRPVRWRATPAAVPSSRSHRRSGPRPR